MARGSEQRAGEIIETDFLIVGGGLSGCMAAILARQKGNVDVAIMERAEIRTSGAVQGLDHHPIMHPSIAGIPLEMIAAGTFLRFAGIGDPRMTLAMVRDCLKPLPILDEIGVKILEDDRALKMIQHQRQPGGPVWNKPVADPDGKMRGDMVYYRGSDLKARLAIGAMKSGARVFNRTILTGLITKDGAVVGATGVNTRTGAYLVFKAKAVLLSTGGMQRMYTYPYAPFPTNLFFSFDQPGNHGGGIAAAYRAGAKLSNMEFVHIGALSAGLPGGGGMFLKMKNSKGEYVEEKYPAGAVMVKGGIFPATVMAYMPDMKNPEIERDVIYYDPSEAEDDEVMAMWFTNAAEWPMLLKFNKARGLDFKKTQRLEIRPLAVGLPSTMGLSGVLAVNEWAETSIKNLFTAGDTSCGSGGGATGSVTWGYKIGEYVRETIGGIKAPVLDGDPLRQIEADKTRVMAPLGRKGDNPLELEDYVRKINNNYVYVRKTEPRLKRAIELHRIAREKFVPALGAKNPHELMRAVEVQDIVDLSEIHAYASLMRKESRLEPCHYRADYPERDDANWLGSGVVEKGPSGEMEYSFQKREAPSLPPPPPQFMKK
jgi:succinate dehydrogenase/fumarate reductase flavoprotein subunit